MLCDIDFKPAEKETKGNTWKDKVLWLRTKEQEMMKHKNFLEIYFYYLLEIIR